MPLANTLVGMMPARAPAKQDHPYSNCAICVLTLSRFSHASGHSLFSWHKSLLGTVLCPADNVGQVGSTQDTSAQASDMA